MELKTCFDFDFKAKTIHKNTSESTVFVSHIDCNDISIACCGNGFVKLYDINSGEVITYFGTGQKALSDMQFANKHHNLLCTSSINGIIAIYDVRSNKKSKQISLLNSPNKQNNALYSVTMDNNIIVGSGKENIYVWDKRYDTMNTLSNYHCADVTKVRFNTIHENDKNLFSISEDCLINEYNLNNINKENELIHTFSVEKELWHFGFFGTQFVYALSNDDSLIVHKITDDDDDDIKKEDSYQFDAKALDNMTLIDCFYDDKKYNKLCLLSCDNGGKLRLCSVSSNNVTIISESIDGHNARIRCAKYIDKIGCFFTGGEDNRISMWKFDPQKIEIHHTKPIPINDGSILHYGAQRSPNNQNTIKSRIKHFSPY